MRILKRLWRLVRDTTEAFERFESAATRMRDEHTVHHVRISGYTGGGQERHFDKINEAICWAKDVTSSTRHQNPAWRATIFVNDEPLINVYLHRFDTGYLTPPVWPWIQAGPRMTLNATYTTENRKRPF